MGVQNEIISEHVALMSVDNERGVVAYNKALQLYPRCEESEIFRTMGVLPNISEELRTMEHSLSTAVAHEF